jgi:hypothetical protein
MSANRGVHSARRLRSYQSAGNGAKSDNGGPRRDISAARALGDELLIGTSGYGVRGRRLAPEEPARGYPTLPQNQGARSPNQGARPEN